MVNFRVVDGVYEEYDSLLYEQFIRLYNDESVTVQGIRDLLNMNSKKFTKYRRKALEENHIRPRKQHTIKKKKKQGRQIKNYTFNPHINKWQVKKGKKYKTETYGAYESEEIAEKIVEKLRECNWNKNYLKKIQKEVLGNDG